MKTKCRLASAEQAQTIARLEAQLSVTHRFRLEDAAGHVDEQLMQAELIKQLRADLAAARQESLDACQILRGLFSGGINGVPDDVKAVAEEVARYVGLAREAVRQEVERLGGELLKANEELSKLRWAESDNTAR
jgi:hypothetical protein